MRLASLLPLTLAEWRHHPWRHAAAVLAVTLGVALAASVQMINHSALSEFAAAVRAAQGEPDAVLAAQRPEGFDDALFARLARDAQVQALSPVLELQVPARVDDTAPARTLRVLGIDALRVAAVAPALLPLMGREARASAPAPAPVPAPAPAPASASLPSAGTGTALALIDPGRVWLNAAARRDLGLNDGETLWLRGRAGWVSLQLSGSIAAGGPPMAVLDLAAAQAHFGPADRLTRIDLRLVAGVDRDAWRRALALPPGVRVAEADEAAQRVSNLSRAYRVNLGVLALVALLVGGFLVYSVLALSVAQRAPAFALLGVLGLPASQRRQMVLAESALIGIAGTVLGLGLGALLAQLALRLLGGDLGGGYFPGVTPALRWPLLPLAACALLGVAAALCGAWWPARAAERLAPAQALKGLGLGAAPDAGSARRRGITVLLVLAAGCALALLPPIHGLPLAAYGAVALLLAGGVAAVPAVVQALLSRWPAPRHALALLAVRRAHQARHIASATVAGVVASLALSVALTVMVASFREAVVDWLDGVLPADLYLRTQGGSTELGLLAPGFPEAAAALPGVARLQAGRHRSLSLDPRQPALALLARPLPDPASQLPLQGPLVPVAPGEVAVYVSEPAATLQRWQPGDRIMLPLQGDASMAPVALRVRGVWRDYARQFGAVAIDLADYRRLTGDTGLNEVAFWLAPGASPAEVERALRALAGPESPVDVASTRELRAFSLQLFDRSFAVTRYLQAVAIGVGLIGVAASLSAQVLARRKEFGLLAHLGLTRRQVMTLVSLETLAWLSAGCAVGLVLGLALAAVLVFVVNPQSFHWTMPMHLPAGSLALLVAAVLAAGTATAAASARRAAARQAVLAVKEDW